MPHVAHVLSACNVQHKLHGTYSILQSGYMVMRKSPGGVYWIKTVDDCLQLAVVAPSGSVKSHKDTATGNGMGFRMGSSGKRIHTWIVCPWAIVLKMQHCGAAERRGLIKRVTWSRCTWNRLCVIFTESTQSAGDGEVSVASGICILRGKSR